MHNINRLNKVLQKYNIVLTEGVVDDKIELTENDK